MFFLYILIFMTNAPFFRVLSCGIRQAFLPGVSFFRRILMKLHKLSSLDPIRTKEIRDMVNICTAHDGTSLSFPFEDGELFLLIEEDHRILSSIAFVPVEEKLYDCSAFTHPNFRGQGFFTDLLNAGIEALPEDSELLFYSDKKDRLTAEVLEAIGAEPDSEEHMMALDPEDFFAAVRCADLSKASGIPSASHPNIHMESTDIDGTPTLFFHSSHASVSFSVFPSHYYLYGFEVEEACRGKGYGTGFLKAVLCRLWKLPVNDPSCPPLFAELSSVRDASALSLRPVLLQVTGDNAPALALYKKTGFRITETLCCYLY